MELTPLELQGWVDRWVGSVLRDCGATITGVARHAEIADELAAIHFKKFGADAWLTRGMESAAACLWRVVWLELSMEATLLN